MEAGNPFSFSHFPFPNAQEGDFKLVTIRIIKSSPPCDKCERTIEIANGIVQELSGHVEVKIIDVNDEEADQYGVVLTPTVIVDDLIMAIGKVPRKDKLEGAIKKLVEIDG